MPVAQEGYQGFRANTRVVITGGRNRMMVGAAKMLPREQVLKTVRRLQEPA